jgi:hypothetical protein
MGCLVVLSRFISCLGERGLPLYRLLKKTNRFTWTLEAQEALDGLKELLRKALILVPPAEGNRSYYTSRPLLRWSVPPS